MLLRCPFETTSLQPATVTDLCLIKMMFPDSDGWFQACSCLLSKSTIATATCQTLMSALGAYSDKDWEVLPTIYSLHPWLLKVNYQPTITQCSLTVICISSLDDNATQSYNYMCKTVLRLWRVIFTKCSYINML